LDGYHLSEVSTTLFVELYDKNKSIVVKKMLPLTKGEGRGGSCSASNFKRRCLIY